MSPEEREQVLEAVADGVLDALRAITTPHLTLGMKLEIANKARRAVAAKVSEATNTGNRFPIMGGQIITGWTHPRLVRYPKFTVPWAVGALAWEVYHKRYGNDQSAERLAQRGGFGVGELLWLLAGAPKEHESELLSIGGT